MMAPALAYAPSAAISDLRPPPAIERSIESTSASVALSGSVITHPFEPIDDHAALVPPVVSRIRVKVRSVRPMQFSFTPGDLTDDET